jgi:hypothetical protein
MTARIRSLRQAMQGKRLGVGLGAYAEPTRELSLQFRPPDTQFGRKCYEISRVTLDSLAGVPQDARPVDSAAGFPGPSRASGLFPC